MADIPTVKMQIVLGGVDDIKRHLKTIKKALKDIEKSQLRISKRTNRQVESVNKRSYSNRLQAQRSFKRKEISIENSGNERVERSLQYSYRDRLKLQSSFERRYLASMKKMARKEKAIFKSSGLGRSRGKLGMTGGMKGSRIAGMAGLGGAAGAMLGGGGGGLIATAMLGGSFALGGPAVAAAMAGILAIGKAFSLVIGTIKQAATDMVGGVIEIGGGFSIADSMMRSAKAERAATFIASNAGRNDPISAGAVSRWSRRMGTGTEFNQLEWAESLKAFQRMTGEVSGFKNNAEFFGKLASVSGAALEDLAESAGLLRKQFDFTDLDIKDIFLRTWKSGKEGVIEITDIPKLTEIIGFSSAFKGDKKQTIMDFIGGAQLIAPSVGGSASEAVTRMKAFRTLMLKNPKKLEALVGSGTMFKDEESGEWKFKSLNNFFAKMAYVAKYEKNRLKEIAPNIRQQEAAIAISGGIPAMIQKDKEMGIKAETVPEYLIRLEKHFQDLNKVEGSIKNLDKAFISTKNTVEYQLKQAFNELGEEVGGQLLKAIRANKGEILNLVKTIADSTPMLVTGFNSIIAVLPVVTSGLQSLVAVLTAFHIIKPKDEAVDYTQIAADKDKARNEAALASLPATNASIMPGKLDVVHPLKKEEIIKEMFGKPSFAREDNKEKGDIDLKHTYFGENFIKLLDGAGTKMGIEFMSAVNYSGNASPQPGGPNRSGTPIR